MIATSTLAAQRAERRQVPRKPLIAGATAPAFALRCGQFRVAGIDDYRGNPLVVVFYVADWHPVCTAQLERYRDLIPELKRLGAELVAISADSVWSHAAFGSTYRLPFPLLADERPRSKTARAYGVFDVRGDAPRRALFVIDSVGQINWSAVFPDSVDPGVDGILTALEALRAARPRDGVSA